MKGLLRQSEHYSYDQPKETMKRIYTNPEIDQITEDALNALCLFVQNRLGVKTGDTASIYWSGREDTIRDYVEEEIVWSSNSTESNFQKWQKTRYFVPDVAKVIPESNEEPNTPALIYAQGLHLTITTDGQYSLMIDRSERKSKDLQQLERELYEYALNEGFFE